MAIEPLTPERRRRQTRDHLLEAAAQVLAERGFHGASLDEVAAAAGFTKGAVYSNFKNKEDLFLALLEEAYTRQMSALKPTIENSEIPPEARLGDFVRVIRGEMDLVPNMGALYLEFHVYALRNPTARARLNELENEDIQAIAGIIQGERTRRAIETNETAERTARIIVALFRGISMMRTANPEEAGEELLQSAIAFVSRALGVEI
jgi:AcrR family transcriptional regulator